MRKKSYITVTDQFCGAGGSSQGVRAVAQKIGGLEVKLALNHWKLAIETHQTNFPDTLHDCTDVSACDPRRYPATDILITSPECTNHSLAKGKKQVKAQLDMYDAGALDPAAERSRATMWDVPRFAEYHKYNIIIVENVVDARKWIMFDAWLMAMHALGYNHKCVYLNSMHCHPTPQSRDRMYVVFWKKGNKAPDLDIRPEAYCTKCVKNVKGVQVWKNGQKQFGKYRQQYLYACPECTTVVEPYYYAAFNAIDWNDLGKRIGDREKPLSKNTVKRIKFGLDKYGKNPFIIHAAYSDKARGVVRGLDNPAFTQTTLSSQAIISPFILKAEHGNQQNVRTTKGPLQTQTTRQSMGLVVPFIVNDQHSTGVGFRVNGAEKHIQGITTQPHFKIVFPMVVDAHRTGKARPATAPATTVTAGGNHHYLLTPFVVENKGQSKARGINEPASTVTTHDYHGLVTHESWRSFLSSYYGSSNCMAMTDKPSGTVSTRDRQAIVNFKTPTLEDCHYRMLKSHEIQKAMAFEDSYTVLGSSKDKVKQLGNAVTPPAMEMLVERCVQSLM